MAIIQERKYEKCKTCGANGKVIQEELYGCDRCQRRIDLAKDERHEVTVFFTGNAAVEHYYFCSVRCVVQWLRAFRRPKNFNFVSLPLFQGRRFFEFQQWLGASEQDPA